MPRFKLTATATYSDADTVSRSYDVDAVDEEEALILAAIAYGRDELDAGRTVPLMASASSSFEPRSPEGGRRHLGTLSPRADRRTWTNRRT